MMFSHIRWVSWLVHMSLNAMGAPWHGSLAEGLNLVSSARLSPQIFPKDVCSAVRLFTATRALCFLALSTLLLMDNGLSYSMKQHNNAMSG